MPLFGRSPAQPRVKQQSACTPQALGALHCTARGTGGVAGLYRCSRVPPPPSCPQPQVMRPCGRRSNATVLGAVDSGYPTGGRWALRRRVGAAGPSVPPGAGAGPWLQTCRPRPRSVCVCGGGGGGGQGCIRRRGGGTPSLCPATVPLTASARLNGICVRQ